MLQLMIRVEAFPVLSVLVQDPLVCRDTATPTRLQPVAEASSMLRPLNQVDEPLKTPVAFRIAQCSSLTSFPHPAPP